MSNAHTAKYKVIEDHLRRMIADGKIRFGERIPSEFELMQEFNCSRGTVRKAVSTLVHEDLLSAQQGAGVFVQIKERQPFIGVIVPNCQQPDHAHMVDALTTRAARQGYNVLLSVVEQDHELGERVPLEREFIEKMGRMHVAGVVKCPTTYETEEEFRNRLRALHIPFVIVNDFWTDCYDVHHVAVDERAAAEIAVEHLVGLGHKRIGFFSRAIARLRGNAVKGFLQALRARGLPNGDELVFRGDDRSMIEKACPRGQRGDLTAIVTPYHMVACGLLEELERSGLRAPDDLSVLCLSDLPSRKQRQRDLTAVVGPIDEMAERALQILTNWPESAGPRFHAHFLYEPRLHIGTTTGPAPKRDTEKRKSHAPLAGVTAESV